MILSKANLTAAEVAATSKDDARLNQLHVGEDGCTAASNGAVIMAVGPVGVGDAQSMPTLSDEVLPEKAFGIDPTDAATVRKALPKGSKSAGLGYAALTRDDEHAVGLTVVNLDQQHEVVSKKARAPFVPWKESLLLAKRKANQGRVCLTRKQLMKLLKAMDQASGDPEGVVFIEFGGPTDDVLLRSASVETGQHVVGMITAVDTKDHWLKPDAWEKSIMPGVARKRLINPTDMEMDDHDYPQA